MAGETKKGNKSKEPTYVDGQVLFIIEMNLPYKI